MNPCHSERSEVQPKASLSSSWMSPKPTTGSYWILRCAQNDNLRWMGVFLVVAFATLVATAGVVAAVGAVRDDPSRHDAQLPGHTESAVGLHDGTLLFFTAEARGTDRRRANRRLRGETRRVLRPAGRQHRDVPRRRVQSRHGHVRPGAAAALRADERRAPEESPWFADPPACDAAAHERGRVLAQAALPGADVARRALHGVAVSRARRKDAPRTRRVGRRGEADPAGGAAYLRPEVRPVLSCLGRETGAELGRSGDGTLTKFLGPRGGLVCDGAGGLPR